MAQKTKTPFVVKITSASTENLKNIHLYVFDQQGNLLDSGSAEKGSVSLNLSTTQLAAKPEFIFAPALPKEYHPRDVNPMVMKKMGAYQPAIRLGKAKSITVVGFPKLIFPNWNWCLITGRLTKQFTIDGRTRQQAVCNARVHICEIDPIRIFWPLIPVNIIDALGDHFKHIITKPKLPIPPHFMIEKFPPVPPRLDVLPNVLPANNMVKNTLANRLKKTALTNLQLTNITPIAANESLSVPKSVQTLLLSNSPTVVRDTIFKNFHLLHPYLCLWPKFWPYFYRCTPIATVYSDCNGRFNHNYLDFNNDKDIYIWVEVNINDEWVTVYRPSIPCNTHWNYKCGTDIHINITDSRVMPCDCDKTLKGEIVWFRSIGEYATALRIEQNTGSNAVVQGANMANVGCTDIINPLKISPFGSTLPFKLMFGDGFPNKNVTHYRWRKTNTRDAALNSILFPQTNSVDGAIRKSYYVITQDDAGHFHFVTKSVLLGAEGSGNNIGYRIPHWDIYQDPGVPAADKLLTIQWTSPDFWSASIDSNSLADGLWRFDLELLHLNAAGIFEVVTVPKQVFQVSQLNNSGTSINAPDNYLNLASATQARNLSVKARIDNTVCVADIHDVSIINAGVPAYSGVCGFLHYNNVGQPVHISFTASHLRNFARFSFGVVKGNATQNPGASQSGYVNSSVGLYSLNSGVFQRDFLVSQLIGSCPQAAFAENLYVSALATDGTRRLQEYDRSDTNAFALSNT